VSILLRYSAHNCLVSDKHKLIALVFDLKGLSVDLDLIRYYTFQIFKIRC